MLKVEATNKSLRKEIAALIFAILIACGLVMGLCFVAVELSKDTFSESDEGGSQLSDANGNAIAVASTDFTTDLGSALRDYEENALSIDVTTSYGEFDGEA
jgi:hypothetical protein